MMVEWEGQHPDEGSIHAWLDGALDASEAALLDTHVRECAECRAHVAEARGLIAGASRVVGLLDEAPVRLIRPASTPTAKYGGSKWRTFRVTPMRASIAAVLLVGLGITLTRSRAALDTVVPASELASRSDVVAPSAPVASPAPGKMKDGLLDSAISRRLAGERPLRKLEPAPGVAIPAPSFNDIVAAAPPADPTAANRVAAAKVSIRGSMDSSGFPADRARVGYTTAQTATLDRVTKAANAAEGAGAQALVGRIAGGVPGFSPAGQCYRVESSASQARWGPVALPLLIAFDSAGTNARILTPTGGETEARATWARTGPDSVVLRLRRIGYNGSLALSAIGDAKSGVMRSSQITSQLSELVTTTTGESRPVELRAKARSDSGRPAQAQAQVAPRAPAREERAAVNSADRDMSAASSAGTPVSVTAHQVSCPTR